MSLAEPASGLSVTTSRCLEPWAREPQAGPEAPVCFPRHFSAPFPEPALQSSGNTAKTILHVWPVVLAGTWGLCVVQPSLFCAPGLSLTLARQKHVCESARLFSRAGLFTSFFPPPSVGESCFSSEILCGFSYVEHINRCLEGGMSKGRGS